MKEVFLNIVICEDNKSYLTLISDYIDQILKNSDKYTGKIVLKADSPYDVLKYIEKHHADIFFLDIDLSKEMNGYELAVNIKEKLNLAYIVFLTSHPEYVFKAFKVNAFDFLTKPTDYDSLYCCLNRIHEDYQRTLPIRNSVDETILFKVGIENYYINRRKIVFFEKEANKLIVHTLDGKSLACYMSFNDLLDILSKFDNFIRCHKSFIANKDFLAHVCFKSMEIEFTTGKKCLIGRKYKDELKNLTI